jgi:hypothetical protein
MMLLFLVHRRIVNFVMIVYKDRDDASISST